MPLIKALATARTIVPNWLYWPLFAILVLGAAGLRAYWTYVLEIPLTQPDTPSYYQPVIENWLLPFSQYRTIGVSMLVSTSLAIFRHPVGILITHGILAVGSSILIALAIKTVLRQNLLSLIVLFTTAFTAKNVALEYFMMSEHAARALYVVYAALVLWVMQKPDRYWLVAVLGFAVALNVLVKPSALVLTVATLMAFAVVAWNLKGARSRVALAATIFLVVNFIPVFGYMAAFKERYGTFSMSQYEGVNQFSHVGHLILLDGGKYPVLKERLKPLIEPYAANYAAKGNYQPNWLIYGSVTEDLKRDFGDRSPARTINEFALETFGVRNLRYTNQIYGDLAMEAMFARPIPYAIYAADRGTALWTGGYSFIYYEILPNAGVFNGRHREDREQQRKWLYGMYGEKVPPCSASAVVPPRATGVPALFYRGPIGSCASLPYDNPIVVQNTRNLDMFYLTITRPLAAIYGDLPKAGAAAAIAGGVLLIFMGGRLNRRIYGYGALLLLILFGYTALHGLINMADAQRMTVNVQDYVVVGSLAFIVCFLLGMQRLLLSILLVWRREMAKLARSEQ